MTSSPRLASPRLASIAGVCRLYFRDTCDATATTTERYFYHAPLPTQHHCPPPSHSVGIYILWLPLFHCCFGLFIGFHFVFLLLCLFYASEFAAFISHRTHLRRATIIGSLLGGSRELSLSRSFTNCASLFLFSHSCSRCFCLFPLLALSFLRTAYSASALTSYSFDRCSVTLNNFKWKRTICTTGRIPCKYFQLLYLSLFYDF